MIKGFIPATKKETENLGWRSPDVIIVTGDGYIDHPFFLCSSAGRFLNSKGIRAVIMDMPDVNSDEIWQIYGRPKLFFLVISGKEDSMVSNYSSFGKYRKTDPFAPGGERNHRPDRAVIRYCNKIKQFYKETPVIIAGAEAAGRMSTHYDHRSEKLRKPILFDSKADMILYGTIEHNLVTIAQAVRSGKKISDLKKIRGSVYIENQMPALPNAEKLPEHEAVVEDGSLLSDHHGMIHKNQNPFNSRIMVQKVMNRYLVIQRPPMPLDQKETDMIFNSGFLKRQHPKYRAEIPVLKHLKDSVFTHRGCLNDIFDSQDIFTEGRFISSRSEDYIIRDAVKKASSKGFNKILRIFGSPFFNHYGIKPDDEKKCSSCSRLSCSYPAVCPNLKRSSYKIIEIMKRIDNISGVRNNYFAAPPDHSLLFSDKDLIKDLLKERNDGTIEIDLKSSSSYIRELLGMGKTPGGEDILNDIVKRSGEYGKKLKFKVSFLSGYPGQDENETKRNIDLIKEYGCVPGKIINFVPLPLTLSSVQYVLRRDPVSGKDINVERKTGTVKKLSDKYKRIR